MFVFLIFFHNFYCVRTYIISLGTTTRQMRVGIYYDNIRGTRFKRLRSQMKIILLHAIDFIVSRIFPVGETRTCTGTDARPTINNTPFFLLFFPPVFLFVIN